MMGRRRKNIFGLNRRRFSRYNQNNRVNNETVSYKDGEISTGMNGENVLKIQNMLTGIMDIHRAVPAIIVDGNFGEETKNAVMKFQEVMGLSATGVVDSITMRELEKEYNVSRSRAEEDSYNMNTKGGLHNKKYDSKIVGIGSSGPNVIELQQILNKISDEYKDIPKLTVDGIFGPKTQDAVRIFQGLFNLPTDRNCRKIHMDYFI